MPGSFSRKRKRSPKSSGRISPPVDVNSIDKVSKFESLIGKPLFVFVYAEWCGHCQNYKPMWKELENDPNRSINIASVRDDMLPKTTLAQRANPVQSYPTVLLIDEEGKAVNFKSESGAETQSVPDHTNMESMRAIVRNIGTPAGNNILKESNVKTLKHPQVKPQTYIESPTEQLSPTISPPNIAADVVLSATPKKLEEQKGGALYNTLMRTAYSAAPALLLFTAHAALGSRKRKTRRKKTHRKRRGSKN